MVSTFEFADHVVGILVDSKVDRQSLQEIHTLIEEKIKRFERINLFVEIKPGVEISRILIVKDLLFKIKHASHFNKIAVVTGPGFFQNTMKIKDLLMKAEVVTFNHENRIKAMNWVSE